jgi:hypothetical protein
MMFSPSVRSLNQFVFLGSAVEHFAASWQRKSGSTKMTPADAPDWRQLSRQELDRGLNNGEAVAGSAGIVAGWDARSAELRQQHAAHLDLRYGPRERNRIDFLKLRDGAPTLLFIHGAIGRRGRRRPSRCLPRARWRMASMWR